MNQIKTLILDGRLDLSQLAALQEKPEPFTPGEPLFWNDPHISAQLLATHLDPATDLASRRPAIIDQTVAWLVSQLGLKPGDRVLDLGCGPGLYAQRFAARGLRVTGMDYSQRSIDYAVQQAVEQGADIDYRYQNYLTLEDAGEYDAVFLIYGDFCPLSPEQRARLMGAVGRALKPDGRFVLDVSTRAHRQRYHNVNRWQVVQGGFWKPDLHLALEQGFDYPQQAIFLDQTIVIEENGKISVYRNWFQDYDRASITAELAAGGFVVEGIWSDLTGAPYANDTEWLGVVARKDQAVTGH